jgi:radical SAM superfamily enzyme YgiQ (UPF0313 family)
MNNVYLFQIQYAIEISSKTNYYLPYSIGCMIAYAKQFEDIRDNWNFGELFFKREDPIEVVKRLHNPKVVGFSNYVWNEVIHTEIAKEIKKQYPECVIVFGGPQTGVSDYELDYCDIVVKEEGERKFTQILREFTQNNLKLNTRYTGDRIENLDECPSPYLERVFDDIIKSHPDCVFAMTMETNRGCPFQCTFCDWGSLTYAKIKKFNLDKIVAELDWAIKNPIAYLIVADANFGVFKARDIAIANLIKYTCDHPDSIIDAVNLQFFKNSTEVSFEIAKIVGKYNRGITLSVQSMTTDVLTAIKRDNMEINNLKHLLKLSRQHDVLTYSEVILPLPLETEESFKDSITELLECGQHNAIEMWMAQLLKNSELASPETIKKYGIEYVEASDYNYYHNPQDWNEKPEKINLINKTNTISTEGVIRSYMYGWMILQMHTPGYTQIISRWLNGVHGVSFRKFYDRLYELIQQDNKVGEIFNFVKEFEHYYITNGVLPNLADLKSNLKIPTLGGHFTAQTTMILVYECREHIFKLAEQIALEMGLRDEEIFKMNRHFIFDPDIEYSKSYMSNYDIEDWSKQLTEYNLIPKFTNEEYKKMQETSKNNGNVSFFITRRNGMKNKFLKQL